jgi:hypothetical protein
MERNSPVEYEPMGNGPEFSEVSSAAIISDQSDAAMLSPREPISFIELNLNDINDTEHNITI